jgi:hypothetical protein
MTNHFVGLFSQHEYHTADRQQVDGRQHNSRLIADSR